MIKDFIAFDFETSGLNFRTDQIIEACIVSVKNGEIGTIFNTMVQPRTEDFVLDPKVTAITGHTIESMKTGIPERLLALLLWEMFKEPPKYGDGPGEPLLVAHNILFDLSFLDSLWATHIPHYIEGTYDTVTNPFLDTLTIARDRLPWPHKLEPVCAKHGIVIDQAHSAYDDTLALAELVLEMQKRDAEFVKAGKPPVIGYINLAGYKRKYGEPEWVPPHATLYPQGYVTETITTKPRQTTRHTPIVAPPKRVPQAPAPLGPPVVSGGGKRRSGTEGVDEGMSDMLSLNPMLQSALNALLDGLVTADERGVPSVWLQAQYYEACMAYLEDKGANREDFETESGGDGTLMLIYNGWKGDK